MVGAMLKDAIDLSSLHRVLVIKLRHLGDVLLTAPVFSVLKKHAPHVEIDALVYRDTEPMLSGHPAVSNIFTVDRGWKQEGITTQLAHEWRLWRSLRARQYDLIVHLTENPRGAILSLLLKPTHSVARQYRARRGQMWRNCFTHTYQIPPRRHTVEMHLDALRRIGIQPAHDERRLSLNPGADAERTVRELMSLRGLKPKGFIQVHPTSRWMFKSWEADKNAALIMALQEQGESVVLTTAPSESELQYAARITAKLKKPVVNLCGQLNLKQLAALTAQAKCFVGVDSVPMHIAAAMQTPTVVLFGPSGEHVWGPWQVPAAIVTSRHACRPCGQDGCGNSKVSDCLTSLSVQEVLGAVRRILASA